LEFKASDCRLKTDIKKLGKTENGLNLYSYRMIWGGPTQIGLMADEVKQVNPDAVIAHPAGFDMVDYNKALEA
jgi:Chaperone of endosialidase